MLTPKEILQIDATILAGLLILLTIVSLDEDISLDIKNERLAMDLEIFIQKNKELANEKEVIDKEMAKYFDESSDYEKQISQVTKILENLNQTESRALVEHDFPLLEELHNYTKIQLTKLQQKAKQITEDIEKYHEKLNSTIKERDVLLEKINVIKEEQENLRLQHQFSFLKTPEQWVWLLGSSITISGMTGVLSSVYEKDPKREKLAKHLLTASHSALFAGFFFMFIVAFTIL